MDSEREEEAREPINGADVLNEAMTFLGRFLAASHSVLVILVLWAAHCWATDPKTRELVCRSTPRLGIVSDEPESGKTFMLEMLALLCPRALLTGDTTAPTLLADINEAHATVLWDEADLHLTGNGNKAVRAVINSGYRRGATVGRVKQRWNTFAPMALAGLARVLMGNPHLHPTITRCLIIWARKPEPGVRLERYREALHEALGQMQGEAIGEWVQSVLMDIATAWPEMPEGLSPRQEDICEILLAIADAAGGDWPGWAREAIRQLVLGTEGAVPQMPPKMRLLADIQSVWPAGADRMASSALVEALQSLEGAPWDALWSNVQMLQQIPVLLGVQPRKMRVEGKPVQGYAKADIAPLWAAVPEQRQGANAA